MTLEELESKRTQIEEVCRRFSVSKLDLFGSVARGEARADSDVDFRVLFDAKAWITLYELMELKHQLSQVLGVEVDLSEEVPSRNPYFAQSLEASRRPFFVA